MAVTRIGGTPKPTIDPTKPATHAIKNVPFRIRPLGSGQKWLKMLVYGPHGSGKTTLGGSACDVPDMRDVLLVNAESGDMSLEDNPRVKASEFIHDTGPITDFYQAAAVLQSFLRPHCKYRDNDDVENLKKLQAHFFGQNVEEIEEPIRFKTVVVDSIREIEMYCLYQLLGIDINNTDFKLDKVDDMEVPEWAEYKKNNQMVQILLRGYRDLPMHVIFACPAGFVKDERGVFHWAPKLTGQLVTQVQGFVDIVGYLVAGNAVDGQKEIPRRMYIQAAGNVPGIGKFDAKNRKSSMNDAYIDDPTLPKLASKIWA